jgi:hypothetical protein
MNSVNTPLQTRRDMMRDNQANLGKRVNEEREILMNTTNIMLSTVSKLLLGDVLLGSVAIHLAIAADEPLLEERQRKRRKILEEVGEREKTLNESLSSLELFLEEHIYYYGCGRDYSMSCV